MRIVGILSIAGAMFLSGCSTEPGGIFRTFDVNKSFTSVATGARQRTIITRQPEVQSRPGLVRPHSIVCAEPSPDVATAIATSFGSGLSVLGYGSGSISGQTSEGVLQLAERTASIQLMRDQMFRACEAYANGAITGTTYTLLMSRITETMVTLLLGETAGGAFGRSLGALGGKASAEAKATMAGFPAALKDISTVTDQLAAAEVKVQKATSDLAAAKAANNNDANAAPVKAAQTNLDKAEAERNALREQLQVKLDTSSEAAGEIAKVSAGGSITAKADAATASVLATMQNSFIARDPSQTLIEACLVELGMWNADTATSDQYMKALASAVDKATGRNVLGLSGAVDLAYLSGKTERTGLFEYCNTHLKDLAPEIYRTNANLREKRLELERRSQDLQWIQAQGQAALAFSSALEKCDGIQDDTTKAECKQAVLRSQQAAPPE